MALSGTINGSFSGVSSAYVKPFITWTATQDIVGNYSTVTAKLYFKVINSTYWGYNLTGSANANMKIDTNASNTSITFELYSAGQELVRTRTLQVNHNADGSKNCWIGAKGNTQIYWGTYDFGQTVTLDTIPREAYITNSVDFQVENDIPLTIWNDGNLYVAVELYVNDVLIKSEQLGQVTSATLTLDGTDDANIYAEMPNVTSEDMYIRVKTYSDAGYTTQIGSDKDKTGTVTIDTTANKPVFTTVSFANLDKSIQVTDKYANVLTTSSTDTLLGSTDKMIKGYSKIRATVAVANKMVAQNSATEDKYRFSTSLQQIEASYSAVSDVTMDLDNVQANAFTVNAFDSRGLSTAVNGSVSYIANYVPISLFGLTTERDNNVDAPVTLSFSGTMFKEYFGGGVSGVENTVTAHYRYKESTEAWGAQTWNALTVTVDGSGNISFSDYVDGDLGASGFDADKSFTIEVRLYDKLTAVIAEITLSRGTPLIDFTQDGIALGAKYNASEGGLIQILSKNILNVMYPVGSVYINASSATNPATLMGFGTWTEIGAGKVLVGQDTGDTDFDVLEETGGAKTHTLTESEIPSHTHGVNDSGHTHTMDLGNTKTVGNKSFERSSASLAGTKPVTNSSTTGITIQSTGGDGAHNNVQPYIVVKMWKRTA